MSDLTTQVMQDTSGRSSAFQAPVAAAFRLRPSLPTTITACGGHTQEIGAG
jgi:hypothetical protein